MKLTVILLLYACCLDIHAAVSPYLKAADYVFQPPALSNLIHGVVCGDTGDYGTLRYEDVAFLNEALFERQVLLGRRLTDAASFMNHVNNVQTNPVMTTFRISGFDFVVPSKSALLPDAVLSTSAKVLVTKDRERPYTNVWESSSWQYQTNVYPAVTNLIRQTMTNGVLNAFTNVWRSAYTSNVVEQASVTNVGEIVDMMFEPKGMHTLSEDKRIYQGDTNRLEKFMLSGPYSLSQLTNLYSLVRDIRRSVPMPASYVIWPTDAKPTEVTSWSKVDDKEPSSSTYSLRDMTYKVYTSANLVKADHQIKYDDTYESLPDYPIDNKTLYRETYVPQKLTLKLLSGICQTALTWRARSPRFSSAHAFAIMHATKTTRSESSHSTQSGTVVDSTNMTQEAASCVVPLGKCDLSDSYEDRVAFDVEVPDDIFESVSSVCSIDFVNPVYSPDPPAPADGEWVTNAADTERTKSSSAYAVVEFSCFFSDFYLILNLTPSTTLEGWNQ